MSFESCLRAPCRVTLRQRGAGPASRRKSRHCLAEGPVRSARQAAGLGWHLDAEVSALRARANAPVLKGEYLKEYEAWRKMVETNHGVAPRVGSNCMPPGMPGHHGRGAVSDRVHVHARSRHHSSRGVDAVAHHLHRRSPASGAGRYDPTFGGHSIGKWEGETLVVDTVGIKDTIPLGQGMRHSDKLHIVERISPVRKTIRTRLIVEMTIEDPVALEKPWKLNAHFHPLARRGADRVRLCGERPQPRGRIRPYPVRVTLQGKDSP